MEEDKAAAYYEELTRKGEGAARFKQGLGFSSSSASAAPSRGSALPSSSSFLRGFVKASSPTQASKLAKQAQLEAIQNKLKKKPKDDTSARVSERSRSRSRSRSRERYRDKDRERRRKRSRSRSRSRDRRSRRIRRSLSPRRERRRSEEKEKNGGLDYRRLIQGYDKMAPAERVKARMKLQLDETAEKDEKKGMGSGWERFEFNKDAPLDDEEIEAVEDDASLVKHIGQSFRFSALEARREEQIKAAHDEAMFGAPVPLAPVSPHSESDIELENRTRESNESDVATSLLSDKVLAKQQGSWRDRVGRP